MKFISPEITALRSPWLIKENTGLGNVLFQLASTYALAKDSGRLLSVPNLKELCDVLSSKFGLDHGNTIYKNFLELFDTTSRATEIITEKHSILYDEALIPQLQNSESECIQINGHLGWTSYFNHYRDDIVSLINPNAYKEEIQNLYPNLFNPSYTPISIHIRNAKDAVKFSNRFYKVAVDSIERTVENSYYFIFIDDINSLPFHLSELNIKNYELIHTNKDYLDLFAMSFCKYHISSISTFAWWGTYLCQFSDKHIMLSREGADFIKTHTNISEETYKTKFYLGNVSII
jgi:hypothetical protein